MYEQVGRRRTRSQTGAEAPARRERIKRSREAMEAMSKSVPKKQKNEELASITHDHEPTQIATQSSKVSTPLSTPERGKSKAVVVVGATFGSNVHVERTPTREDLESPPHVRRVAPPSVRMHTPEKTPVTSSRGKQTETTSIPPRHNNVGRGSSLTRKRMISFSPERAPHTVNEALAQQKLERNLKANVHLQSRLDGTPVKTSPGKHDECAMVNLVCTEHNGVQVLNDTPSSSHNLSQTLELMDIQDEQPPENMTESVEKTSACKKELVFTNEECDVPLSSQSQEDFNLSQGSESVESRSMSEVVSTRVDHDEEITPVPFTSTSVIEDVGLFNCETDVEFTGGVYGEGTDGKVSAAMVCGQKVAIKRAKPHEGYPEEEAKQRSAVELYYLRKVRHLPGFVQCLGLCDGIEHTCIALEVMDCKLSDYLRRYGAKDERSTDVKSKRRFTLSLRATKAMLKQIAQPMMVLHDQVNVAHGDLACRNILLQLPPKGYEQKWDPVVKLADFGRIKAPSVTAASNELFESEFNFFKNMDVGSFAREILFRLLVGEVVPANCTETKSIQHLSDIVVNHIPESARLRLGPYYRLFMRCTSWGVRPSFREILEHLDDLEYFETTENGFFPLKPKQSTETSGTTASPMPSNTFLSPDGAHNRMGATSSGSKGKHQSNKYETPSTGKPCASTTPGSCTKQIVKGGIAEGTKIIAPKPVNWLKARSVLPTHSTATPVLLTTPNGPRTPLLRKKTPPSAGTGGGASRRSLQILNQIQHLQHQKDRNKV